MVIMHKFPLQRLLLYALAHNVVSKNMYEINFIWEIFGSIAVQLLVTIWEDQPFSYDATSSFLHSHIQMMTHSRKNQLKKKEINKYIYNLQTLKSYFWGFIFGGPFYSLYSC